MIVQVWYMDKLIARRLRDARERAGYSKAEFAQMLGLSKSGYTPYEKGEHAFTVDEVARIAQLLGRSMAWFLGMETNLTDEEDELLTNYRQMSDEFRAFLLKSAREAPKEQR